MSAQLRHIDLAGRPRRPGRKAAVPQLTWLPVAMLRIDDSYQRPIGTSNWKNIEAIAAEFDWARFTPVLAAPLDGGLFAIIDGQHRTHAAALRGHDAVPAMVVPMTHAEQARAFAWVNGQVTAMTVFHVYKAALAAMEPWALRAQEAVEAAGCKLMTYNASAALKKPREVYSIGMIRRHVEAGRAAAVTRALAALSASSSGDGAFAMTAAVLGPWIDVVAGCNDEAGWLAGFLDDLDLEDVLRRAAALRKQPQYAGMSNFQLMRGSFRALLDEYRKHGHVSLTAA